MILNDVDPNGLPQLMSVEDAARFLGVSRKTLYYWVECKRIPFIRVGRMVFLNRVDILGWVARCKVEPVIPAADSVPGRK
jgi:excisionase family DNA binding protein